MRVDGEIVRGCLMLAVQCDGAKVETIEGLSDNGEIADLQAAFEQRNALQCGYCTPGMIAAAQDLLKRAKEKKACRAATKSANICPATTAAAPAITPSSTRWKRSRRHGRGGANDCSRSSPRKRGPSSSGRQILAKIVPCRVLPLDDFEFPTPVPFLELPFAKDCGFSCFVDLVPNQRLYSIQFS